jgi:hypothetical protein
VKVVSLVLLAFVACKSESPPPRVVVLPSDAAPKLPKPPSETGTIIVDVGALEGAGLDLAAAGAAVESHRPAVVACYQAGLRRNPLLRGMMKLELTVGAAGEVTAATAQGFEAGVADCLAAEARTWVLPAPAAAPATLGVPFAMRRK